MHHDAPIGDRFGSVCLFSRPVQSFVSKNFYANKQPAVATQQAYPSARPAQAVMKRHPKTLLLLYHELGNLDEGVALCCFHFFFISRTCANVPATSFPMKAVKCPYPTVQRTYGGLNRTWADGSWARGANDRRAANNNTSWRQTLGTNCGYPCFHCDSVRPAVVFP